MALSSAHVIVTLYCAASLLLSTALAQSTEPSEAVMDRTRILAAGLLTNENILANHYRDLDLALPGSLEFLEVLRSLGEIKEQEDRVASLLTGDADDQHLVAIRAVFQQLLQDACDLVVARTDIDVCTYDVLLQLKAKTDAWSITQSAINRLRDFWPSDNVRRNSWIFDNRIQCQVSGGAYDVINRVTGNIADNFPCV